MLTSNKLLKQKKIRHGFFNRNGGKSTGIYKSLNCGLGSNDKKNRVNENLNIVKRKLNIKSKNIFLLNQVHSNKIIFINKNNKFKRKKIKADAVITDQKKLPIAVLTADCVPILLHDNKKNMIAAVHAGWKGAFKNIVNKVISFMINKGCKEDNIIAAIGPSIQEKSYNVRKDFLKKFIKKNKKYKIFFKKKKKINLF